MQTKPTEAVQKVSINIRKVREFRNYTQFYMGSELGISQNAYSKIEINESKLTIDRLFEIAAILEVQVSDLIELDLPAIDKIRAKKIEPAVDKTPRKNYVVNYFRRPSEIA